MQYSVAFSRIFLNGRQKSNWFCDQPALSPNEGSVIADWVAQLHSGDANLSVIDATNRPSWLLDANGKPTFNTRLLSDKNIWHYHCGHTWDPATLCPAVKWGARWDLGEYVGQSSAEAIHYCKWRDNEIIVLGYSRKHTPFDEIRRVLLGRVRDRFV